MGEESGGAVPQSPSMLVPLRSLNPGHKDYHSSLHRQLAVVDPTAAACLPDGWIVQGVPRLNGDARIDKYYYEPESGQKFRSLPAVKRYLTGEENAPKQPNALRLGHHVNSSTRWKMIVSGGKMLRLDEKECGQLQLAVVGPTPAAAASHFTLPDGWIVKAIPHSSSSQIDKYYYEPVTGQQFRSLVSVQKYLEENSVFGMKTDSRKKVKTKTSSSADPPLKVKWVLGGPGGESWNPFIGDSEVPNCVKQEWAERFVSSINGRNYNTPNSE